MRRVERRVRRIVKYLACVRKIGNSLYINLPREAAQYLKADAGVVLEVTVKTVDQSRREVVYAKFNPIIIICTAEEERKVE